MSYEITLINLIKNRDEGLYGRLKNLEKIAEPLLCYTQGKFPFYTPHGFSHSKTVEENLDWITPDSIKDKMNNLEIFFLIIAAWLHDWGMVGEISEDPKTIRENHNIRTEINFEKYYKELGLTEQEAQICGRISKGHRKEDLFSEDFNDRLFGAGIRIRVGFLAALLRIADETDVTHSRTPEVIYFTLNPCDESQKEFERHMKIGGIGQLEEKHKIYLFAIANDPLGAEAIRKLVKKIQCELNGVKSILSQNGITLDTIELRLETRGFIDKPIAFRIDNHKIVDLLIGKHLYENYDVAIRELIQNAIDTCSVRRLKSGLYSPSISIEKNKNTLTISDNGMGMSFFEAKQYLSNIGETYYNSDNLKEILNNQPYDPISHFGIGLLSSFLIASTLIIETKMDGQDSCLFTATLGQQWKYEKGNMNETGTKIKLVLNNIGERIILDNVLKKYFVSIDIPLFYKDNNQKLRTFKGFWSGSALSVYLSNKSKHKYTVITEFNKPQYDVIILDSKSFANNIVIYNKGIYVCSDHIHGLSMNYTIVVNIKISILDLHISREDVVKNEKWSSFLYNLFNDIFDTIIEKGIYNFSLLSYNTIFEPIPIKQLYSKYPIINSFVEKAPFPLVKKDKVEYTTLSEVCKNKIINFYNCSSKDIDEEVELVQEYSSIDDSVFNPYNLPSIGTFYNDRLDEEDLLKYLCTQYKVKYNEIDLRTVILENIQHETKVYENITPVNACFTSFGKIKPIVVIKTFSKLSTNKGISASPYWSNYLLLCRLLEENKSNYNAVKELFYEERYCDIIIKEDQKVLIDSTDEFISKILTKSNNLTKGKCSIIKKYFMLLSYLPLVFRNASSCLLYFSYIDYLEDEIAEIINEKQPSSLIDRMEPSGNLYTQYYSKISTKYYTSEQ